MQRFVDSIRLSIRTENWYSASTLALTLPDICGWLSDPTVGSQKRYESWFEAYLSPFYKSPFHGSDFTFLSGRDCYALRCAYLHEGTDEVLRQRAREVVSRFAFTTTGSHCVLVDTVLLLNVQRFCADVCTGTESWARDVANDQAIQARVKELLLVRTEGFFIARGVFVQ